MDNTVVRVPLSHEAENKAPSFPDAQAIVAECVSEKADAAHVQKKLAGVIARAREDLPQMGEAQADRYLQCLAKTARGLRRNTEDNLAFRYFYFGRFQAHVEQLERETGVRHSEEQVLAVANRKHFAPIMQRLFAVPVCRQQELANKLGLDRSNLYREMQRLEGSGLVEASTISRSRYYRLTPQGRRYYHSYLVMKSQLEEQTYSPGDKGVPSNEKTRLGDRSQQQFLPSNQEGQGYALPGSRYKESLFADKDIKARSDEIYHYLGRNTEWL